jgi:hypothetical protein
VSAQTGEIRGKITESDTKQGAAFATVTAKQNNTIVQGAVTDMDGNYVIKPLVPGKYDIEVSSVGYQPAKQTGIVVNVDKASYVNISLGKGIDLVTVDITEYKVPLIDKGTPQVQKTFDREQIQQAPTRDVNSIAAQGAGVFQKDEGGALNIRGSRSDGTSYYVDGIKVRGGVGLPQKGTEQITVITGGVPAQYGDATGGIISVTTRGPSKEWAGGIELATSELLDSYGYNLASFDVSGPLLTSRDSTKKNDAALAGFFIAGEYQYDKDPSPPGIDIYKVKDEILDRLHTSPYTLAPGGTGLISPASYFTYDSLTKQKYRENVSANAFRLNGKIDVRPAKNVNLTFGGSIERTLTNDYIQIYSLLNYDQYPQTTTTNWRAFAKMTQRFSSEGKEKSSSVLKNAYYSVQVDYSKNNEISQSPNHKENAFNYGHVGTFKTESEPFYKLNDTGDSLVQIAVIDTHVVYTPSPFNPFTAAYTSQYYDLTNDFVSQGFLNYPFQSNLNNIQSGGGLLNGDNRNFLALYGLWALPGRVRSGYTKKDNSQIRVSANGSVDIKNHNIVLGLEFEQRTDRAYTLSANSLWTIMRQLSNLKFSGYDPTSAVIAQGALTPQTIFFTNTGVLTTNNPITTTYTRPIYNSTGETTFFENIRDALGLSLTDTVNVDAYDPSTFKLSYLTADELLNGGNSLVNYYGYDYTGNLDKSNSWNLNNFFTDKNDNNNFIRRVDAFRPNYIAGYIQDKFQFNDIIFNVGVRIDRFDANQKVLKDPYSIYELHTANDVDGKFGNYSKPENIGNDYKVYVNNSQNPTTVLGYRNGDIWYNSQGEEITDLSALTVNGTGGIQPYLLNYDDAQNRVIQTTVFKDYEPQVNVMPRVAFSFPISDEAYFAAHYDILTQRPQNSDLIRFNPITYYNWAQGNGGTFSNPDLKPESTTDYEINFQQKISRSSAFSISAFYKELRNMVQIINLDYAYPIKYSTYGNIDFGTVKGLTFAYDLRRTNNIRMNINYTLQFADGTGSDPNTSSGILSQAGQTNLREIKPLSFDQRHTFVTSIDFRYGKGKDYTGPVWFNSQVFANAGINFVFRAGSGTPYTRKSNITPEADFTSTANSRAVIAGQLNGSRYPWQFKIDLKIDKDFEIGRGKNKAGNDRKPLYANVYLQVLNVLNTLNVSSVYAATGNPSDDGYISSPGAQASIANQVSPQAYIDLYHIAVNNPSNYELPRRIRLGVQFNF